MIIGYARVSTDEQSLERQLDILTDEKCDKIYKEKITGNKKERPELDKLLNTLACGDTIVVTELTRLSRSTRDLFRLVDVIQQKGADIKSLKESWLDTTTPHGKLMFTILAGLSQFERDLISERTKEGLKSARARGRKGGRPSKPQNTINKAIALYNSKEYSLKEIKEISGVSPTSLYRYLGRSEDSSSNNAKKNERVAEIKLWLRVENNNKFVRGKKKSITNIEDYLEFYDMKKPEFPQQNGDYLIYVKYTNIDDLKDKIYDILSDLESEADLRNCFTESEAICNELGLSW
jgi:DNA invertase Pin-like site-specific DNA recombinase